ncbi:MAG: TetR/AcrR family transcriptional regulator [Gemmataceae bacterium]
MTAAETHTDPKHRLIVAAQEVFAEKGFEAASVREICSRAGANGAAINYHFGTKERLYSEACRHAHNCGDAGEPMPEFPLGTPPEEKLRQFIRIMAVRMHAPASPASVALLMRELANPSAAGQAVVHEYIKPKAMLLREILQELRPDLTPQKRLMIGFSIIGQILYYRQNRTVSELLFGKAAIEELSTDLVAEHIVQFSLSAVLPRGDS